jgi:hypothetical protein
MKKFLVIAVGLLLGLVPEASAQRVFEGTLSVDCNWCAGFAGLGRGGTHMLLTNGVSDAYMECRTAPGEWARSQALRRAGDFLRLAGQLERDAERLAHKPKRAAKRRAEALKLRLEAADLIASVEPFRVPVGGKCRVAARTYGGAYSGGRGTIGVAVDFYDGSDIGASYLGTANLRFRVDDYRLRGETLTVSPEDVAQPRRLGDPATPTSRSRSGTDTYKWFYGKQ